MEFRLTQQLGSSERDPNKLICWITFASFVDRYPFIPRVNFTMIARWLTLPSLYFLPYDVPCLSLPSVAIACTRFLQRFHVHADFE